MYRKAWRETMSPTRRERTMGTTRDIESGGVVELDVPSSAKIA
jgi:hypothetical protein